ncbi:MAG: nitrous oxide reductase accessory protein NosL [Thermomicrobiales bacterium]|nr:nitrous oxide reductase accessory protein NosL [Thermomicrobiales bacterium]
MTSRRKLLATGAALPFVLVACGGEKVSGNEPPSIKLGRDACQRCGMIISEERFASGIVDDKGKALKFDDTGEMVATVQEEGLNGRRVWVHGYPSVEWMDATTAWYVVTMDLPTPMGSGVFPFDTEADANEFANEHDAVVYAWDDLLANWTFGALT